MPGTSPALLVGVDVARGHITAGDTARDDGVTVRGESPVVDPEGTIRLRRGSP